MAEIETADAGTETGMRWLSGEEAREEFDAAAQRWLGMSGDEFLRRWDAGEYRDVVDDEEHMGVPWVATLIPWVRP